MKFICKLDSSCSLKKEIKNIFTNSGIASNEEDSCHRKKCLVQPKISRYKKTILGTGRKFLEKVGNFMSQQIVFHVDKHKFLEEISCTRRNFIL